MKIIQGFVTKAAYIDNNPQTVSEFFELSPLAFTYSRTRGEYQQASYVGDILHTFKTVDVDAGNAPYKLPDGQVSEVFAVTQALANYLQTAQPPYDTSDFRNTIQAQFPNQIRNLVLGPIHIGAQMNFPEWVSWESVTFPGTQVKIWYVNQAFENQYSNYEIVVVPPIDNLDDFFGNYGSMVTRLNAITPSVFNDRVQDARGDYPDTVTRIYSFSYVNPNNPQQKNPSPWAAIIYGRNGDNIDSVKDAIVDYVLSHSTHNQNDWQVIFPDLFRRTEFLFYPRWDKVSIPNLTDLAALYSSLQDPAECIVFAKQKWTKIAPVWIENNLTIVPFDFKAIAALGLNGQNNADNYTKLRDLFKDYIPVSTASPDFSRMTQYTQRWVLMMVALLKTAETVNENSSIVNPMRRIKRDGILYISQLYDNVNYLVAARTNP